MVQRDYDVLDSDERSQIPSRRVEGINLGCESDRLLGLFDEVPADPLGGGLWRARAAHGRGFGGVLVKGYYCAAIHEGMSIDGHYVGSGE